MISWAIQHSSVTLRQWARQSFSISRALLPYDEPAVHTLRRYHPSLASRLASLTETLGGFKVRGKTVFGRYPSGGWRVFPSTNTEAM